MVKPERWLPVRAGRTRFGRRRYPADGTHDRRPYPAGFGTIWTTVVLDLVGFGIIVPLLALYVERFHASATTVGFLFASFSLAQFVFAPVWGRVSDRVGALDAARATRDFAAADAIRAELQREGWLVETTKDGSTVRRA